ncbi:a1 cistron-splicing factor aar2 protein [Diplodia corticola]|uniref:A1 cistron-splicing factor aar2 protein n=1 Tax=Diplodia corticola TaxID=236234 RepID=A0A1J9REH3_9PEZI|nr:a1 cistron-splicing factor aar2 protein [Diplodia corticola]OJD39918.1 a1 cistron-splicing factor aar2 protein [Diplodia corticola]
MSAAVRPEDVAFNCVSVALARSQSLVASWLPPRPAADAAAHKTSEQLADEESALFAPGSDILGVGAEPPKDIADGSFKRSQLSSNERLRQQILGKNATKGRGAQPVAQSSAAAAAAAAHLPSKKPARPTKSARAQDDSDDDEDGRAAMFRSKKRAVPTTVENETSRGEDDGSADEVKGRATSQKANAAATRTQEKPRKRPASYLDELLEERSKKKNKKQKAQAEVPVKAAAEKSKADTREEKPTAKEKSPNADDGFDEESDKATAKSASAKVSIQHGESGDPTTTAENALLDRSDKKKKKKKKKKNKGEATEQS